jgi:hypothetical protein
MSELAKEILLAHLRSQLAIEKERRRGSNRGFPDPTTKAMNDGTDAVIESIQEQINLLS